MLSNLACDKILKGPGTQWQEGLWRQREAYFWGIGEAEHEQRIPASVWN